MQQLDLTLATPAENLALDEALLEAAETADVPRETLRMWESPDPLVVLGRSSRIEQEVRQDFCRRRGIPVLRRSSGGAAIVAAPGCLMYALVLSYETRPALRLLDVAHRCVLETMLSAIRPLASAAGRRGTSDLALGELKFSGNSVRCKRRNFLYHGTLLYDFPLSLAQQCLTMPPRQPDYRHQREHGEFLTNLPIDRDALVQSIVAAWQANEVSCEWPRQRVAHLVARRYGLEAWNETL